MSSSKNKNSDMGNTPSSKTKNEILDEQNNDVEDGEGNNNGNKQDDCSDLTDNNHETDESTSKSFPQKLLDILSNEDYSPIISWLPHGNGFIIHKKKAFAIEILPKHFKASKFTSFTRKLNRWGFSRAPRGPETGAYFHKMFNRDKPDMVLQMTSNSGNKVQATNSNTQGGGPLLPAGTAMPTMMMPTAAGTAMPFYMAASPQTQMAMQLTPQQQQAFWHQQMQLYQFQQMQMFQFQQQQAAANASAGGTPGGTAVTAAPPPMMFPSMMMPMPMPMPVPLVAPHATPTTIASPDTKATASVKKEIKSPEGDGNNENNDDFPTTHDLDNETNRIGI